MRKITVLLIISALLLTGCADAVDIGQCLPPEPYGFWSGIWHGSIAPFSFRVSLFSDNVAVYAVNNTGGWYDCGFLIGICCLGVGSSKSGKSKR